MKIFVKIILKLNIRSVKAVFRSTLKIYKPKVFSICYQIELQRSVQSIKIYVGITHLVNSIDKFS